MEVSQKPKRSKIYWIIGIVVVIVVMVFLLLNNRGSKITFAEILDGDIPHSCRVSSTLTDNPNIPQVKVRISGSNVRIDQEKVAQGQTLVLRDEGYYTSIPEGNGLTHFETGEECQWLLAIYEPGSEDDPNFDDNLLFNLRELDTKSYKCEAEEFGPEVFQIEGTVCSFSRSQ